MKRVIIMGAGHNQLRLIEAAQSCYDVFLCDGNDQAKGRKLMPTNRYFHIDISDPDALISFCTKNEIDGVVCNTESLMLCASIVQKRMGFIGNDPKSILNISDKSKFRQTQRLAGVFHPETQLVENYAELKELQAQFRRPVIIKPDESSGSRGISLFESVSQIDQESFDICRGCSRNKKIVVEEFIQYDYNQAYEAEAFLINGKLEYLFLFKTIRDMKKHLVPQCYYSDNGLSEEKEENIRRLLQKIFETAGIVWGEYNVELVLTSDGDIFVIEINPRQGGMMLPTFVNIFSGIDVNKLLVTTAVGDYDYYHSLSTNKKQHNKNVLHYRLLTDDSGIYHGYNLSLKLQKRLVQEFMYYQIGEKIVPSSNGYTSIGTLDFVFESAEECLQMRDSVCSNIQVIVK